MGKVAETRKGYEAEIPAKVIARSNQVRMPVLELPSPEALCSLLPLNGC